MGHSLPLYWRVCLINGTVFVLGLLALVVTPATVSSEVLPSEVAVLVVGLLAVLVLNAVLLRRSLAPIDRVIAQMAVVRLPGTEQRLAAGVPGPGGRLAGTYNAMIDRLERERSDGNVRAISAQEAERERIARELHDEIGQQLTVVLLGLSRAVEKAPPELAAELADLRDSARSGLDDVRRVARRLRPGVLDDLGLTTALASLASEVSERGGPRVERAVGAGLPDLAPEVELVVYRVAQEALTNVLRHAAARSVGLSLTRRGDAVVLEVRDDGRGFDVDGATREGAGLLGMRDRAVLVGGTLRVDSDRGGTRVRLEVPVP